MKNKFKKPNPETRPSKVAIIYRSELDYINQCILDYPNIETGGQLFGFITEYGAPVVCYAIGPGPNANHQTTFFNQDEKYLQQTYDKLNRKYGLRYIGEWHSHHHLGLAKPSGHDASTVVRGMKSAQFRHFLLCIGNCDNKHNTTLNAFTFHIDHRYNYHHATWEVVEMESPYRSLADKQTNDEPETVVATSPEYAQTYWMNNKANNLVLKNIINFLKHYDEEECKVIPVLDDEKQVVLLVQRNNRRERIVFGKDFPNDRPQIVTTEATVNPDIDWVFLGDIYEAFLNYYKEFFSTKTNNTTEQ